LTYDLTSELDLDSIKVNQQTRYLGQRSKDTGATALPNEELVMSN